MLPLSKKDMFQPLHCIFSAHDESLLIPQLQANVLLPAKEQRGRIEVRSSFTNVTKYVFFHIRHRTLSPKQEVNDAC